MADGEVLDADTRRDLIVKYAVEDGGGDSCSEDS